MPTPASFSFIISLLLNSSPLNTVPFENIFFSSNPIIYLCLYLTISYNCSSVTPLKTSINLFSLSSYSPSLSYTLLILTLLSFITYLSFAISYIYKLLIISFISLLLFSPSLLIIPIRPSIPSLLITSGMKFLLLIIYSNAAFFFPPALSLPSSIILSHRSFSLPSFINIFNCSFPLISSLFILQLIIFSISLNGFIFSYLNFIFHLISCPPCVHAAYGTKYKLPPSFTFTLSCCMTSFC